MEEKKLLELLETAIGREKAAYDFYMDLHGRVDDKTARDALAFIANEEKKHREFLEKYRDGRHGPFVLVRTDVEKYMIAEHEEAPEVKSKMESKDVYLVAAHRELAAHEFYKGLAAAHEAGEIRTMLLSMANEELKHKEKMEYLYTNTAFPQTAGG